MTQSKRFTSIGRVGLVVFATALGLVLALAVTLAADSDFDDSYKEGPLFAGDGDVITYTIAAVYSGTAPSYGVVLSDVLPYGANFASCSYITATGVPQVCTLPNVWQADFSPGERITAYLAVTIDIPTMYWPLVNRAYISFTDGLVTLPFTTTVNPYLMYLPVCFRNYTP